MQNQAYSSLTECHCNNYVCLGARLTHSFFFNLEVGVMFSGKANRNDKKVLHYTKSGVYGQVLLVIQVGKDNI